MKDLVEYLVDNNIEIKISFEQGGGSEGYNEMPPEDPHHFQGEEVGDSEPLEESDSSEMDEEESEPVSSPSMDQSTDEVDEAEADFKEVFDLED